MNEWIRHLETDGERRVEFGLGDGEQVGRPERHRELDAGVVAVASSRRRRGRATRRRPRGVATARTPTGTPAAAATRSLDGGPESVGRGGGRAGSSV